MTPKADFKGLWTQLVVAADEAEDPRLKAVLMNHEDGRERICRRLGVVTDADVRRIVSESLARKASRSKRTVG